jgi:glycosyltransferase involved in cell wall biosynthesis
MGMGGTRSVAASPLSIGIIAPPWLPVPPSGYGGTELVLDALARGLTRLGHSVVLFTVGESTCDVERDWLFERCDPDRIGAAVLELGHAMAAYDRLSECDVVHDHTLAGVLLAGIDPDLPVVTTNHGPFNDDLVPIDRRASRRVGLIAVSCDQARRAPSDLAVGPVIHHGLDLERYRFGHRGDYLLSLARMHPAKGLDLAIEVARRAGMPLLIAAKNREEPEHRYFDEVIRPRLGGDVEYVGEVGHDDKVDLLAGAKALVNPIRWPEPFGLSMIEAMACGSPVIATRCGAAPEIVTDGDTGFLADTVDELVAAVHRVDSLDRRRSRRRAELRFSMEAMASDHASYYRLAIESHQASRRLPPSGLDHV